MAKKPTKPHYDVDLVRQAARTRWAEILSSRGGIPREHLDGKHHPCSKCGGTDRFRALNDFAETGGLFCNNCFCFKNGDGFAAYQWATGRDFPTSLAEIAEYLGIPPSDHPNNSNGRHKKTSNPSEGLAPEPWSDLLAQIWCAVHKPPITTAALTLAHAKQCFFNEQFPVLTLPVFGEDMSECGHAIYHLGGQGLPIGNGQFGKIRLTKNCQPGWIGQPEKIGDAKTVWILEGCSDLLTRLSLPLAEHEAAVSHSNGAGAKLARWQINQFAGKQVIVLHDADTAGENGTAAKSAAIAPVAAEVKIVRLPYPVIDSHGHDLRDWINEGHAFEELQALVAAAPIVEKIEGPPPVVEEDDDPHRLARLFADHRELRYWREEWWEWDGRCYQKLPPKEIAAQLNHFIKIEYDRIWRQTKRESARKVTRTIVNNVTAALEGQRLISGSVEFGTWLGHDSPAGPNIGRKDWLSMANGICQIDRWLAGDVNVILPHSPQWWSPIAVDYDFDPLAKCPLFEEFLLKNLEGDFERIQLLMEWAGYCLLPTTRYQKFLVLEGEGANGKSVYCSVIRGLVGEKNVEAIPLESFAERFQLTQTLGKLVNIAADCGEIEKAAEGVLKSFTSGDAMFFDRKGISGITAVPTARLILAANNRPRFSDRSSGIWRRMLLVPWRVQIAEVDQVKGMDSPAWWFKASELPGIFNWALRGLDSLITQGRFCSSKLGHEAIEDYKEEVNPARSFLVDNYESAEGWKTECGEIYEAYKKWCKENGYHPLSNRTFGREVKRIFPSTDRKRFRVTGTELKWHYYGIGGVNGKVEF